MQGEDTPYNLCFVGLLFFFLGNDLRERMGWVGLEAVAKQTVWHCGGTSGLCLGMQAQMEFSVVTD